MTLIILDVSSFISSIPNREGREDLSFILIGGQGLLKEYILVIGIVLALPLDYPS